MKNQKNQAVRSEFVQEYKNINKDHSASNAIKQAFDKIDNFQSISQASACDVTIDFLLTEKLLTIKELASLIAKDSDITAKIRIFFINYHVCFKNKNEIDSFKRLQRHLASDTIAKLLKRKAQLT